ncbi:alanine racemase [Campylobacter sp. MIT 99-7217]|uniref:alanine racemase n=1 Tax=Campylobacter sp. MIT 99-7217 TaxID=535091 RepID=UPI00115988B2|nr:alanine racemase [Campylobacter sp. MIT 99-7217]TQR34582.1 alanine racemase [Campylobacter sp. MIT 99-7217]
MAIIKLNQKAYKHNLCQIASKAGGFKRLICVFKNNAYGHGVKLLAPIAKELGVCFIALKNEREALEFEDFFDHILILSHIPNGKENPKFIYALNDIKNLALLKKGTRIHLAIDTGMHRNGVKLQDIKEAFDEAKKLGLRIEGIFTHFLGSDEMDASFFVQRQKFNEAKKIASSISETKLTFHACNSSALFRSQALEKDELCRVGLAQFGYAQFSSNLKKVLSLYAHKLSSRVLQAGQSVGYGGKFCAKEAMKIATYDLGYADGLFRFDGKGKLRLANGAFLLGKMSMDSFSCEDFGEELCVFDDANVWAEFFHTIDYEILAKLSPFIPRVLV